MNLFNSKTKRFTELYNDFYPVIYSTVYSKILNQDAAGDLTQEIFTRFYEKMDEIENPRKWLWGTMKNVLFEYYKKHPPTIDIEEIFSDANINYLNGFRDTRIILQEAFDSTENFRDDRERVIYELIAIRGFTFKEASALTGLTTRQVNYKYKSVVERIIDYLRKRGISNLEELL